MAFTATVDKKTVFGDERVIHYTITADAATGVIDTGLGTVVAVQASPASMASAPFSIKKDELAAGTASAGSIAITGVASGDEIYVTVYGR